MALRVEGFAIVSDDGMLADASGVMPRDLLVDADQRYLSDALDRAAILVHGRNSHEGQPHSRQRRRLIATRSVAAIAQVPDDPNALLWNPAGMPLEDAAVRLGVHEGSVAVLGGTDVYGLFLPRYDVFHLSRMPGLRLPGGRPVFPGVPEQTPEETLSVYGLRPGPQRLLDAATGVSVTVWRRCE
ncbi:dihydrofolate reductase [Pseudorhodoplanes sp.]|uniref:dihydrofolate reductase n=1 Tax=Pseudorhodoplanes sp. TaxID=1934341 RepID=UPI00391D2543